MDREALTALIDAAAGRRPADLLITNCRLVDVFNQKILDGPLALTEGRVAGWGPGRQGRETLDARGGVIIPGLIDGHVHIESSSLTPARFAECVLPFGTTTVVADPHEIANVRGLAGIRYMLEAADLLPLNIRVMLPSCVPATDFEQAGAILTAADLDSLIDEPGVLGLGEVMDYPAVINHSPGMLDKLLMARKHGLVIDGHSPGLTGRDLMAYAAAGLMTDHECTTPAGVSERLSLGQYVLLRWGSSARDLPNLLPALTPANARRCVLCTDDREAADILSGGHLNMLLRECVAAGVDPILAVTLATLNAAECFRLRGRGAIAPGYKADLVIVEDLRNFKVRQVFIEGREIARNGRMLVDLPEYQCEAVLHTVHLPDLNEESFNLPLKSNKARVIGLSADSVMTRELILEVARDARGNFNCALNPGLNKVAVIERHRGGGDLGLGILADYGLRNGALAVSVAHDSHNLVVVGDNDRDMLAAALEVKRLGGGYGLCREGRILGHLALPVAGLMSDQPAWEVAESLEKLIQLLRKDFGVSEGLHPLMKLIFLTLPVIPELKLTSRGLFDVTAFKPTDISVV